MVETEGVRTLGFNEGDFYDAAVKQTPLGRIGQPDDIGRIAAFLASDAAYWVNGQLINASGGQTM